MILLDANVLLYAYIEELPQHEQTSRWLEHLLEHQAETVAVAWAGASAFLRVATNKRIFKQPWSIGEVAERLDGLLLHPMIQIIGPTERHWAIFRKILTEMKISGDVVMDAHIAALAVEHNASVATADKDFRRFLDYVKIIDPLAK